MLLTPLHVEPMFTIADPCTIGLSFPPALTALRPGPGREKVLPLRTVTSSAAANTAEYSVGYRTKEIIDNLVGEAYSGRLMSDGYTVYRAMAKRLRCWAHRRRNAKELEKSLNREGCKFGKPGRARVS